MFQHPSRALYMPGSFFLSSQSSLSFFQASSISPKLFSLSVPFHVSPTTTTTNRHSAMAKGGSIWKLKFMIKKWRGLSKTGRSKSSPSVNSKLPSSDDGWCLDADNGEVPVGYQAVYVGKSRRRYVIRSDHVNHPLVRELVDKSEGSDTVVVGCEVVLFEHLLWMLVNAEPQQDSIDELVGFYAC